MGSGWRGQRHDRPGAGRVTVAQERLLRHVIAARYSHSVLATTLAVAGALGGILAIATEATLGSGAGAVVNTSVAPEPQNLLKAI